MNDIQEVKSAIRTCHYRNDFLKHERYLKHVICRLHCLPCLRVIELGKCDAVKERENNR